MSETAPSTSAAAMATEQQPARAQQYTPSPEMEAGWYSRMTFGWLNGIIKTGHQRTLQSEDIFDIPEPDHVDKLYTTFAKHWSDELSKEQRTGAAPSLCVYKLINDIALLLMPVMLNYTTSYRSSSSINTSIGRTRQDCVYDVVICRHHGPGQVHGDNISVSKGVEAGSICQTEFVCGQNYKPDECRCREGFVTNIMSKQRKSCVGVSDQRVKATNEVLQGIKIVKLYAWEQPMTDRVQVKILKKINYLRAFNQAFFMATNTVVVVATFAVYVSFGGDLTPAKAFTSLSLFSILRFPVIILPFLISQFVDSRVSYRRLYDFLRLPELSVRQPEPEAVVDLSAPVISVKHGTFKWGRLKSDGVVSDILQAPGTKGNTKISEPSLTPVVAAEPGDTPVLKNIDLDVYRGETVIIAGPVGSGKSSLLSSLLGELEGGEDTRMHLHGTVAYVAQQPWICNATLRENILFGLPYNADRYADVIHACALQPDIDVMPGGDLTEIGEKGINLSGGQKARVSLARAVYADAEVYLLDAPLESVDPHVARDLVNNVIRGMLKDKTVVLCTNQLQFASIASRIFYLSTSGEVLESGTYSDLMSANGTFANVINTYVSHDATHEPVHIRTARPTVKSPTPADGKGKLLKEEARESGVVKWTVYKAYLGALGGGMFWVSLTLVIILAQATQMYSEIWLSHWSDDEQDEESGGTKEHSTEFYLWVFTGISMVSVLILYVRNHLVAIGTYFASINIHANLLKAVISAPMKFFDITPLGRIVNRFSSDIDKVDSLLPQAMNAYFATMANLVSSLVLIIIILPVFLVFMIPVTYFYVTIQSLYRETNRELKRLESMSRSPIYAHFSETLSGLSTIRAYRHQSRFIDENVKRLEANCRALYASVAAYRWLDWKLQNLGSWALFFVCLVSVYARGSLSPGFVGLLLVYTSRVAGTMTWAVRQFLEAEAAMNAVERTSEYSRLEAEQKTGAEPVPIDWPQHGQVQVENLWMRYRPELDCVLKDVNFTVEAAQKIGVSGRTGSGKSSILVALFRLAEPEAQSKIIIDGVDIMKISLFDLRSKLAIIPQDPVLFSGTIKSNLDPFGLYDDEKLWNVLEQVQLKMAVSEMSGGLDARVVEYGENLSMGQRQLLCLGRALLRNNKIIMMDESTAAVDVETDSIIQKIIRTAFVSSTVLTIAHRLNTIIDSDRILVMSDGKVAEYDSPSVLVRKSDSIFNSMLTKTGAASAARLRSIAIGEKTLSFTNLNEQQ